MLRLLSALSAIALCLGALSPAPIHLVAVLGAIGLLLSAIGIATLWRWPVTAAACVFVTDYTLALWLAGASVSVVGAAGFGLGLLILLQSADRARCARRATVDASVVRSQLLGWMGFAAATVAAAVVIMAVARGLAASVPFAAAPVLAAAAALGVVLALAAGLRRAR